MEFMDTYIERLGRLFCSRWGSKVLILLGFFGGVGLGWSLRSFALKGHPLRVPARGSSRCANFRNKTSVISSLLAISF